MRASAVSTARAAADAAAAVLDEAKRVVDALHAEQARLQAELAHVRVRVTLGVRALAVAQGKADAATKWLAEVTAEAEGRADRDDAEGGGTDDDEDSSSTDTSGSEDDKDAGEAATAVQLAPEVAQSAVAALPSPPRPRPPSRNRRVWCGRGKMAAQERRRHPHVRSDRSPRRRRRRRFGCCSQRVGGKIPPPPAQNVKTRRPWTRTPDTWCKGCLYRVCAMPGGRKHDPPGLGRCLRELPEGTPHPPLPEGFVEAPPAKRGRPPRGGAA